MYYDTETAVVADMVLPAAGWVKRMVHSLTASGALEGSEIAVAPGEALADYWIFLAIAQAWGFTDLVRNWSSPADAFQQVKRLSAGRPCDITGIRDYDMLDRCGGIQWHGQKHRPS